MKKFAAILLCALFFQKFANSQFKSRISKNLGDCLKLELEQCCQGDQIKTVRTQTCQCQDGYVAGQVRGIPSCVPDTYFQERTFCRMDPCPTGEQCENINTKKEQGWLCKNFNISKKNDDRRYLETKVLVNDGPYESD